MHDPRLKPQMTIDGRAVTAADLVALADGGAPGEFLMQLHHPDSGIVFRGRATVPETIAADEHGRPALATFRFHNEVGAGKVTATLVHDGTLTKCPQTG
jgi:hypothetical protein